MANYTKTTIGKENRIELHEKLSLTCLLYTSSHVLGGKVERADVREYGKTEVFIDKKDSKIFQGVSAPVSYTHLTDFPNPDSAVPEALHSDFYQIQRHRSVSVP